MAGYPSLRCRVVGMAEKYCFKKLNILTKIYYWFEKKKKTKQDMWMKPILNFIIQVNQQKDLISKKFVFA